MPVNPPSERALVDKLTSALLDAGATVERPKGAGDQGIDLLFRLQWHRYAVQLKVATLPRTAVFVGLAAIGVLEVKKHGVFRADSPLLVIGGRLITEAQLQELKQFMANYGDGIAWGVIDQSGFLELYGPGLDVVRRPRPARKASLVAPSFNPFSDLSQWMLKLILNHRLPPALRIKDRLSGQHLDQPLRAAADLTRAAQDPDGRASVSVSQASKLLVHLRAEGFLADSPPLELIRMDELLRRWRAATLSRPPREVGARWLIPQSDASRQLHKTIEAAWSRDPHSCCLGLFAACHALGYGFVGGVAPHLYVREISEDQLRQLRLTPVQPGEKVDVFLRAAPFPESIFQSVVFPGGLPVTDIVQCWLDVVDHPARGDELADILHRRVLQPALMPDA